MEPSDWTRQEILQAASIFGSLVTAILSFIAVRMAKGIHVMINSRMGQMIDGARAEGRASERVDQEARDRAQESRSDRKQQDHERL